MERTYVAEATPRAPVALCFKPLHMLTWTALSEEIKKLVVRLDADVLRKEEGEPTEVETANLS